MTSRGIVMGVGQILGLTWALLCGAAIILCPQGGEATFVLSLGIVAGGGLIAMTFEDSAALFAALTVCVPASDEDEHRHIEGTPTGRNERCMKLV